MGFYLKLSLYRIPVYSVVGVERFHCIYYPLVHLGSVTGINCIGKHKS